MSKIMSARLRCCVPFCNRTKRDEGRFAEWICAEHWGAVPKEDWAILARIKHRARKAGEEWSSAAQRIWSRCKRIAIERAGGI